MASHADGQAAVLLLNRERLAADHRRAVGRVARHRNRRAPEIMHDDHHHRQRVREQDTRPDARASNALSVRRVAVGERGTGAARALGSEVAADVDSVAAGEQLACAER